MPSGWVYHFEMSNKCKIIDVKEGEHAKKYYKDVKKKLLIEYYIE